MKFWFGKDEKSREPVQPTAAPGASMPSVESKPTEVRQPVAMVPPEPAQSSPAPAPVQVPPSAETKPQVSQRDLYCRLMNALYDAVLVLDEEGHVVDSNDRVEAIFGYTEEEMWDRPARDLIKGFGPQLLNQIAVPLREHRPVLIDGSCVRKDGAVFAAEIAVGSVRLARGENIVISIRDVDKRMTAIMERLRSQGVVPAKPKPSVVRLVSRKADAETDSHS